VVPRAAPIEPAADVSTPELLRSALDESREMVRLELAHQELPDDVRKLKGAAMNVPELAWRRTSGL